jgi:hypothetical protein
MGFFFQILRKAVESLLAHCDEHGLFPYVLLDNTFLCDSTITKHVLLTTKSCCNALRQFYSSKGIFFPPIPPHVHIEFLDPSPGFGEV